MGVRVSTLSRKTNIHQGIERNLNRKILSVLVHLIFVLHQEVVSSQICPPGSHLSNFHGTLICLECLDGTFMPYNHHTFTDCNRCEEIKDPEFEILVSPCNKTHNAVIHCVEGYYRDQARNPREAGTCQKCTNCPDYRKYTGQACSTYKDSICCMDENYDVVPNHGGAPVCRERPWLCRQGQYFNTRFFRCSPCPSNTFMSEDFHVRPECFKCRNYTEFDSYRPVSSVIVQPCNSTHDTVLGCQDGFFIKYTMGYRSDAIGCSLCTKCSTTDVQYEGRKCASMQDTVCCPQINMTVVDTPDGLVCKGPSLYCPKGFCLQYKTKNRFTMCVPCDTKADDVDDTDHRADEYDEFSQREMVQVTPEGHLRDNQTSETCNEINKPGSLVLFLFIGVVIGIIFSISSFVIICRFKKLKLYSPPNLNPNRKSASPIDI